MRLLTLGPCTPLVHGSLDCDFKYCLMNTTLKQLIFGYIKLEFYAE